MSIMFARAVVEVAKLYDLPAVGVRKEEAGKKTSTVPASQKVRNTACCKAL